MEVKITLTGPLARLWTLILGSGSVSADLEGLAQAAEAASDAAGKDAAGGTDVMMTSQVLRGFEQRGLLERAVHPSDKRARAVGMTPPVPRWRNRANVVVQACDRDFFGRLGPGVGTFQQALRTLRTNAP